MNISKQQAEKYFNSFKDKNIMIIGDVMVDSYMWGKVNRISPEAPIPIVSITDRDFRLGGAANVALNINALGATAFLCSVIGCDEKGLVFEELLKKNNLSQDGIVKLADRKTTVKTRIISGGQHLLRVDEEVSYPLANEVNESILDRVKGLCVAKNIDVIIFEDYDKGVLSENLIKEIIDFAKNKGILITVDPKKKNYNSYQNVDLFKPNLKEFAEGEKADINAKNIDEIKSLAKDFIAKNSIENLMITLSEQGVFIANSDEMLHFPAMIRAISDVSGAGDTVISVASLLMAAGAKIDEIAQISNLAGGLVCEKAGVVPVNVNDLLSEF